MKKAILLVALVATVIIAGYSCNWFGSDSSVKNPFIGKWKIDSVQTRDSASVGMLAALGFYESASHHLDFTDDSVTVFNRDKAETSPYKVDKDKKQIAVDEELLGYEFLSDSSLQLTGSDSTLYLLHRK
jgi:hypothetical protein